MEKLSDKSTYKMKNLFFKFLGICIFGFNNLLIAQAPPTPEGRPGGGAGGTGPGGKPKNPIDMYEYILVIAAVLLVLYFYKRSKRLKLS